MRFFNIKIQKNIRKHRNPYFKMRTTQMIEVNDDNLLHFLTRIK